MATDAPTQNSPIETAPAAQPRFQFSLDWWAVITALLLVLLIFLGVFTSIPW